MFNVLAARQRLRGKCMNNHSGRLSERGFECVLLRVLANKHPLISQEGCGLGTGSQLFEADGAGQTGSGYELKEAISRRREFTRLFVGNRVSGAKAE